MQHKENIKLLRNNKFHESVQYLARNQNNVSHHLWLPHITSQPTKFNIEQINHKPYYLQRTVNFQLGM